MSLTSYSQTISNYSLAPLSDNETIPSDVVAPIYQWLIPLLCIFLFVSVLCNILILSSVRWIQKKPSPYLRVCISLSAADASTAFLLLIGLLLNSYFPVVHGVQFTALLSCLALVFETLRLSLLLISDLHLLALALVHYFSLLFPLHFKVKMTSRLTIKLILLIWSVPFLILVTIFSVQPNQGFRSKACHVPFYHRFPFRLAVFLMFSLPLLISLALYLVILTVLWCKKRPKPSESSQPTPTTTPTHRRQQGGSRGTLNRKKLGLTTALITGTFVICWFPLVLWFTLACLGGCYFSLQEDFHHLTAVTIGCIVNALVILNFLLNPLIYALRLEAIQGAIRSRHRNRLRKPNRYTAAFELKAPAPSSRKLSREQGSCEQLKKISSSERPEKKVETYLTVPGAQFHVTKASVHCTL